MKNVTISLDEELIDRARSHAQRLGKSFNRLVGEMLEREVDPERPSDLKAVWAEADRRGTQSSGPYMTRDEIYAERLGRYPHS